MRLPLEHHPECVFIYVRAWGPNFLSAGAANSPVCCARLEAWQAPPPTLHAQNKLRTRHTTHSRCTHRNPLSLFSLPRPTTSCVLSSIYLPLVCTNNGGGRGRLAARLHFKFNAFVCVLCWAPALGRLPLVYVRAGLKYWLWCLCKQTVWTHSHRAQIKLNCIGCWHAI